jgi:hypothetical protein
MGGTLQRESSPPSPEVYYHTLGVLGRGLILLEEVKGLLG